MKTLLCILLSLLAGTACGQDYMLNKYKSIYFHQNKEYNWKELGELYNEYEEPFNLYSRGRRNFNSAKWLAIAGGIPIGIGLISYTLLESRDFEKSIGSTFVAFGVFAELGALIFIVEGRSKLGQAKKEFNFEMMKRFGYKSEISLAFGTTSNGAGLFVQF